VRLDFAGRVHDSKGSVEWVTACCDGWCRARNVRAATHASPTVFGRDFIKRWGPLSPSRYLYGSRDPVDLDAMLANLAVEEGEQRLSPRGDSIRSGPKISRQMPDGIFGGLGLQPLLPALPRVWRIDPRAARACQPLGPIGRVSAPNVGKCPNCRAATRPSAEAGGGSANRRRSTSLDMCCSHLCCVERERGGNIGSFGDLDNT
jgi:hypothetical protein